MKILVTMTNSKLRDTFFTEKVKERLKTLGDVEWNESSVPWDEEELAKRLLGKDVCFTGWGSLPFKGELLKSIDSLKVLAHTGGSLAGLVSKELYEKGVRVLSGNEIYAESVAEGVIAYALSSLRRINLFSSNLHKGIWLDTNEYSEGLLEQEVGLVGFGAIARYLANMLKPFRCKIKAYDPFVDDHVFEEYGVERDSLENIFSKSNIISLHVAKRPETNHMIGRELLGTIKDDALFINTARSSIVDTSALVEELRKNRFSAFLDVFDEEPLPEDSPLIGLPNVTLMPHRAGPTVDRRERVVESLIDDIERIGRGEKEFLAIDYDYAIRMTQ